MKALGTDDSITNCDCCGKSGLKFTVIVELDNGEIAHYGQICARRNTGKTQLVINSEIKVHQETVLKAARAEFFASQEYLAERARFAVRPSSMLGRDAMAFVKDACAAADSVRRTVAAKHGVTFSSLI